MTDRERRQFLKQLARAREDFFNWPHGLAEQARQCMARFPMSAEEAASADVIGWMWAGCFVPAAEASPLHRAEGRAVCLSPARSGYRCADCKSTLRPGWTCDRCGSSAAEDA